MGKSPLIGRLKGFVNRTCIGYTTAATILSIGVVSVKLESFDAQRKADLEFRNRAGTNKAAGRLSFQVPL
jgi:hypothetical protein